MEGESEKPQGSNKDNPTPHPQMYYGSVFAYPSKRPLSDCAGGGSEERFTLAGDADIFVVKFVVIVLVLPLLLLLP